MRGAFWNWLTYMSLRVPPPSHGFFGMERLSHGSGVLNLLSKRCITGQLVIDGETGTDALTKALNARPQHMSDSG